MARAYPRRERPLFPRLGTCRKLRYRSRQVDGRVARRNAPSGAKHHAPRHTRTRVPAQPPRLWLEYYGEPEIAKPVGVTGSMPRVPSSRRVVPGSSDELERRNV